MMSYQTATYLRRAAALVGLLLVAGATAITPEALRDALATGEKLTIVDIRDSRAFKACHIAGAINIPATVCPHKRLPALGDVIVYGDGVDVETTAAAAAALDQKAGIDAEVLAGGLMAWRDRGLPCTEPRGVQAERLPTIAYDQLARMAPANENLVLVDLRTQPDGARSALTSLNDTFPGKPVTASPFGGARSDEDRTDIYVLIDNGDGSAQKMARKLRAAGIQRFVILAGGEETLKRGGAPGSVVKTD
jgi:rhodanese-related sulfurtransferase